MTISSSNIFPFVLGNMFRHGLNSFHTTASTTGGPQEGLRREFPGDVRPPGKLLGPQELSAGAQRVPTGLHL